MANPLDTYVERSVEAVLQDVLPGWVAAGHTPVRAEALPELQRSS